MAGSADALRLLVHVLRCRGRLQFAEEMLKEEESSLLEGCRQDKASCAKALLSKAEIQLDKGSSPEQRNRALRDACKALGSFRELQDAKLEGLALLVVADAHLRRLRQAQDALEGATEAASQAVEHFQELGDQVRLARALQTLAKAHMAAFNFEEAEAAELRALAAARGLGDRRREAEGLQRLAALTLAGERPEDAVPYAEAALEVLRALPFQADCEALCVSSLTRGLCARHHFQEAAAAAKDGVRRFQDMDHKAAEGYAHGAHMFALARGEEWEKALRAARRAEEAFRAAGDWEMEARYTRAVAEALLECGRPREALRTAQEALAMFQEDVQAPGDHDALEEARCLTLLATIQLWMSADGSWRRSNLERDKDRALQLLEPQPQHSLALADALLFAASVHHSFKEYDDAGNLAARSRMIFKQVGHPRGEGRACMALCKVQLQCQEVRKALHAAELAAELLQECRERVEAAQALLLVAHATLMLLPSVDRQASPDEFAERALTALQAAGEAASIAREVESAGLLWQGLYTCGELLLVDGRPREARECIEEALQLVRGDPRLGLNEGTLLLLLATACWALGDRAAAVENGVRAQRQFREVGNLEAESRAVRLVNRFQGREESAEAPRGEADDKVQPQRPTHIEDLELQPWKAAPPPAALAMARPVTFMEGTLDLSGGVTFELVADHLRHFLEAVIGMDGSELENETPLMQAGLSSSNAIMVNRVLMSEFPGTRLPLTLVFDHPSVNSISELVVSQMAPG